MGLIAVAVIILFIIGLVLFIKHKTKESKVPQGLQVFNENAEIILDLNDVMGKVLGYIEVPRNTGHHDYPVTHPRLADGTGYIFSPDNSGANYLTWGTLDGQKTMRRNQHFVYLTSQNGDTINIHYYGASSNDIPLRIYFGVY
ncbi:hypothetical protein [Acinetobacter baumannii]|uniref:hypothetical protein n=1 Tax=Acinetobacter baumannii TaxID=470 RepID=UPI00338DE778